tara:strand:+ start:7141 stop:7704 length:564 start_codon:yes stop_codon:yes gene_type:complete
MSSATANSAARKRRAGKNNEPIKNQGYNNKTRAASGQINEYEESVVDSFVPVLNQRDAIYYTNRKISFLENTCTNLNNINNINNLKIESLEKKLNDTIISNNIKINLLETDLLKTKEANIRLENEIELLKEELNTNTNFLSKMQSLVVYNNDDDDDEYDDDDIKVKMNSIKLDNKNDDELVLQVENL